MYAPLGLTTSYRDSIAFFLRTVILAPGTAFPTRVDEIAHLQVVVAKLDFAAEEFPTVVATAVFHSPVYFDSMNQLAD